MRHSKIYPVSEKEKGYSHVYYERVRLRSKSS